jgi:hypothetical protein
MVTVVSLLAVCPLSSVTLQLIATGPAGAPVEVKAAVVEVPSTVPAAAE